MQKQSKLAKGRWPVLKKYCIVLHIVEVIRRVCVPAPPSRHRKNGRVQRHLGLHERRTNVVNDRGKYRGKYKSISHADHQCVMYDSLSVPVHFYSKRLCRPDRQSVQTGNILGVAILFIVARSAGVDELSVATAAATATQRPDKPLSSHRPPSLGRSRHSALALPRPLHHSTTERQDSELEIDLFKFRPFTVWSVILSLYVYITN